MKLSRHQFLHGGSTGATLSNEKRTFIRGHAHRAYWSIVVSMALLFAPQAFAGSCKLKGRGDVKVVIDVGHTPTDTGQISARGVAEFEFNTRLAQQVTDALKSAGFRSARMIVTEKNGHAGLELRAQRANDMDADIFLSIHHNGVKDTTLIPWQYQGEEHYYLDNFKGYAILISGRNHRYDESLGLARILADRLIGSGLEFTTHHDEQTNSTMYGRVGPMVDRARGIYAFDNIVVLHETEMPALILEAGMIVNRHEEVILASPVRRATIARAVVDAVSKFCAATNVGRYAPGDFTYKVIDVPRDDVLNIRSEPASQSSILGTIPANGRGIQMTGDCTDDWCKVQYNGARGWVNRKFLGRDN
jgi:N-acetylmuramoyl-L-alanine amidase